MKIGICDDESIECEKVERLLQEQFEQSETRIYSPKEIKEALEQEQYNCDIMIMDIEFKGYEFDGIQITKLMNEKYPACQIVYLTHILEFAPDVYETEHCYFVMKNNMEIMLPQAMKKAIYLYHKDEEHKRIEILSGGKKIYVASKEIIYVEKLQRCVYIQTTTERYESYQSLLAIKRQMNEDMIRCHSSYIVNLKYVSKLDTSNITMTDGTEIPIGRTYRDNVKQQYLRYWSEQI